MNDFWWIVVIMISYLVVGAIVGRLWFSATWKDVKNDGEQTFVLGISMASVIIWPFTLLFMILFAGHKSKFSLDYHAKMMYN